jgi:hypothetical protein
VKTLLWAAVAKARASGIEHRDPLLSQPRAPAAPPPKTARDANPHRASPDVQPPPQPPQPPRREARGVASGERIAQRAATMRRSIPGAVPSYGSYWERGSMPGASLGDGHAIVTLPCRGYGHPSHTPHAISSPMRQGNDAQKKYTDPRSVQAEKPWHGACAADL